MELLIKKYENRKLYNTNTSKYINFNDFIDLIKYSSSQATYKVIDINNEDITNKVLKTLLQNIDIDNEFMINLIKESK